MNKSFVIRKFRASE